VMWDIQNAKVESTFNKASFLENTRAFLDAARSNDIPVVYTKITPLPVEYESPFRLYLFLQRQGLDDPEKLPPYMQEGTWEAEIHKEVSPMADDVVFNKHTPSIFIGTHFEHMVRNMGITTIMFTGITTEVGIASSARDSANRGFYTIVVEDCVSTESEEMHEAALKTLNKVVLVLPSNEIIKAWK